MESEFVKVAGSSSLYKNLATGVVINTDEGEIELARNRKKLAQEKNKKEEKMSEEVSSLKNEISELKTLISELLGKQNAV
jgi:hypothetical protein